MDGYFALASRPHVRWQAKDFGRLAEIFDLRHSDVAELVRRDGAGISAAALPPATAKDAGESVKAATFVISDGTPDRVGDVVSLSGMSLRNYGKNPVVLWSHNPAAPIGRSTSIGIVGGRLKATVQLATGASPIAAQVSRLIGAGILKGSSIGFVPKRWDYNRDRGGIDFHESELLEWSVVSIPAAPGALLEGTGKAMTEAERARAKRKRNLEIINMRGRALGFPEI